MQAFESIVAKRWDAIVVGTGMGGGTLGYALARAGKSVLFLEMGVAADAVDQEIPEDYVEQSFGACEVPGPKYADILARAGRYNGVVRDVTGKIPIRFTPFMGRGVGGSSGIYGMAFERFPPYVFDGVTGCKWPISYRDLEPYYDEVERLYRVSGQRCSILKELCEEKISELPDVKAPMGAANQMIFNHLQGRGLHPYRLPLACERRTDCLGCQGYLCKRSCKNDSKRICVDDAVAKHGAVLLDCCEVTRIRATAESVTSLECLRGGRKFELAATQLILACGALETPRLLLSSRSDAWPEGVANGSGLVGRYLMRHFVDLVLVKVKPHPSGEGLEAKSLAFNDVLNRYGTVQSFGLLPPARVMFSVMLDELQYKPQKFLLPLLRLSKPIVISLLSYLRSRYVALALIAEDSAQSENRVMLSDGVGDARLDIRYSMVSDDKRKMKDFRDYVRNIFKPYRVLLIENSHNNRQLAHACGTCRFGDDPKTSVLDRHNKVHGMKNLYIVDASFFPSSASGNPSLTIAANALRVAKYILENWR